ncbi:MAG TPA: SCO family protein [Kofleriaceae bacterium]|nr:SCO family protein [Kofleriaceae bacterium]
MRLALFALACAACSGRAPTNHVVPANRDATPTPAPVETAAAPAAPLGPSIYDLPVHLTDSQGRAIGLDVARGAPVLVTMFYASCSIACPLLVSEVGQVLAELPEPARSHTRVLLVSFDAERDTPERLAELVRERKLDARWIVAAAPDADARALAAVLGFRYRKVANGDFAHGSTIVALDAEGRPIARTDALGQRAALVRALSSR